MKVYNTATRQKEEFKPINDKQVGIYSCGPTVYSSPHIGNMYAYVCWDVLVRTLQYLGYDVKHVINITDVGHLVSDEDSGEDKMEKGAKREGLSVWNIAKKYENEFIENLKLLNIEMPWKLPKATEHIKEQIDLVKVLEKNGFTYRITDGIYYDTSKFPEYGNFAHLDLEKIKEGARVEANAEKRNPSDFAVWKFSGNQEPRRQMEWFFEGPKAGELVTPEDIQRGEYLNTIGFPGWHIECTAMSTEYLGNPFDIHTGGEDHIPVHHTNEIAQAYGVFGHNTANYWMHNSFITFNGSKISKSSGGLYTEIDLVDMGFDPLSYRYMILGSNYRKGIEFSLESLKAAEIALNRLRVFFHNQKNLTKGREGSVIETVRNEFREAISNDLGTPEALAVIWNLVSDAKEYKPENIVATLLDFDKVLGIEIDKEETEEIIPEEVQKLAEERLKARQQKNWQESDRLREIIINKGYLVEDLKDSYKIKKI
jgi:cysteinyl-tRNA synthetase